MKLVMFGANGPTGLELCRQALAAGHRVTAAVRRPDKFLLRDNALSVVPANVTEGSSLVPVIGDADAVLSTLGAGYSRHEIHVYSVGTKAIVSSSRKHKTRLKLNDIRRAPQSFDCATEPERQTAQGEPKTFLQV